MINIDAKYMVSLERPCKSCPFAGSDPIQLSPERLNQIYRDVFTFSGSHLCHSAGNQMLCRGARDLQISLSHRLGFIKGPTDKAFQAELEKY